MGKVSGIDLGTTYSCIAYVNDFGKAEVVPNMDSSPVTPSVVAFEESGNASVGEAAKEVLSSDPANVCSKIKREMGKRDFTYEAFGVEYTPETISAIILKKLVKDASDVLGEEVKDVVITCPAYFGMEERNATETAGKLAGLNVLGILNEPTAAAISYGMSVDTPQTVLVYDLGGGTFDVTIIQVEGGNIRVIATGGNHELGGKDWDDTLRSYLISQYGEITGEDTNDLIGDLEVMGDLELKSEKTKKMLSQKDKATVKVQSEKIEVTREKFEELTKSLLESTIEMTRKTMGDAEKKGVTHYDKILLVGGSSIMPQVQERLKAEFPSAPIEFCDPNQSVAKGAAIYGINIAAFGIGDGPEGENGDTPQPVNEEAAKNPIFVFGGKSKPQKINVVNVLSRSIGMMFVNGINNLVKRNTEVPCDFTIPALTQVDNQTGVELEVYENLTDEDIVPEDMCKLLVSDMLDLTEGLPAESPINIKINITATGLLNVDVTDMSAGGQTRHMEVMLQNALDEQQLKEEEKKIAGLVLE